MIGVSAFARQYLRTRSVELMNDACVIHHPGAGRVAYDRTSGQATNHVGTALYTGPCRLWEIPAAQLTQLQGDLVAISTMYLSLPYDAPVPEAGDIVQMTVSADPNVVGRTLDVVSVVRAGNLRGSRRVLVRYTESGKDTW